MERVYDSVGRPGIFRNDRFWLAGDHRVEPPLYDNPKVRALMDASQRAQKDFKMTDFQGFNVSRIYLGGSEIALLTSSTVYYHAHGIRARASTTRNAGHWR